MSTTNGWGAIAFALTATLLVQPAHAQKQGGILKSYVWDTPPSASIHEEATISTVFPFMPVFNNLVLFDQTKKEANLDTIVPDLGKSWTWDNAKTTLTFQLEQGREMARRQAVHGEGRQMHVRSHIGDRAIRRLPQEPAQGLVSQRQGDHDQG